MSAQTEHLDDERTASVVSRAEARPLRGLYRASSGSRRDSFSSLDADDEADESEDTVPARLFTTLSSSGHNTHPSSRHNLFEYVKGRTKKANDAADDDNDSGTEPRDESRAVGEAVEWRRRPAKTVPAVANESVRKDTDNEAEYAADGTFTTTERASATLATSSAATPQLPALTSPSSRTPYDSKCARAAPASTDNLAASLSVEPASEAALWHEAEVIRDAARRDLLRTKMQEFGCCVLFFPSPVVSWLFPMTGNVGITNAEGSRLYTFESSYYVREEKLLPVLDTVLGEDNTFAELLEKPKPPPVPRRVAASPIVAHLQPSSEGYMTSPLMDPQTAFGLPPAPPGSPRKAKKTASKGHAHARCVRIWDLKPLLMEARSQRCARGDDGGGGAGTKTSTGRRHTGPAAALWHLLRQELNNAVYSSGMTSDSDYGTSSSPDERRRVAKGSGSSGGVTEDDDEPFEFLDANTARMFNRNLQASIKIFRGSPHGGSTQSERLLEELNSFSFVCFVLEACGVGGWASPAPRPARARLPPRPVAQRGGAASSAFTPPSTAATTSHGASEDTPTQGRDVSGDDDEDGQAVETSWGFIKLCIHLCVFGTWYRCGGRARRVLHGGSFTTAILLWALLLAFLFYYLFPPRQWGVMVAMAQNVSRSVWASWTAQTAGNATQEPPIVSSLDQSL